MQNQILKFFGVSILVFTLSFVIAMSLTMTAQNIKENQTVAAAYTAQILEGTQE